jgi:serine/threonine protein kinase
MSSDGVRPRDSAWGAPAPGDLIAGKYEVEGTLGAGGMGVVVIARHRQLGQRVAVKVMRAEAGRDENAVERFLREARAVVALSTEYVAEVKYRPVPRRSQRTDVYRRSPKPAAPKVATPSKSVAPPVDTCNPTYYLDGRKIDSSTEFP